MLERWITPSLFEGTDAEDEYTFMQQPDAAKKIQLHQRSFMTEADFRWLHEHGVNAVSVPVGYWLFEADGPFSPTVQYLDWAFQMAEKYALQILVDLHGVKGSQNGKDHSGQIGRSEWLRYRHETIQLLKKIAKRYKDSPVFWGVELLNEPSIGRLRTIRLKRFYREAYAELMQIIRPGTYIVFNDGFSASQFTGTIRSAEGYPAVMDVHWYQVGRTDLGTYFKNLSKKSEEIKRLEQRQPIIVGEWSGMLSHENIKGYEASKQDLLHARHIEQQLAMYEGALGWFYWTYKTESDSIWNFRTQIENGRISLGEAPDTMY